MATTPRDSPTPVHRGGVDLDRLLRRLDPRVHLTRYRSVVAVFTRHGLGVARSRLPWRSVGPITLRSPDERPIIVHLREAIEELGTTFIKAGQALSTRADILPAEAIAELAKLQDSGPTVDIESIRSVVEAELGAPLAERYAEFDPVPIASASIGQVHGARLPDGRSVVVKIQKPGVAEQVEVDLAILGELARTVFKRLPRADLVDPEGLVDEFGRSINAELDYLREAGNADEFRGYLKDDPTIHIPEVIWSHTTSRVITLERLEGTKVDNLAALDSAGIDRRDLADRCAALVFRQVFRDGFFHADPHPGNMLVLSDGRLGLLDFGMAGRLDGLAQDCLLEMLTGFVERDADRVIDGLEMLGVTVRPQQRRRLRTDVSYLVEQYRGMALGSLSVAREFDNLTALARKYRLRMPSELLLLTRALSIAEGVGRRLWPGFVTTEVARPYLKEALMRRTMPSYWGPRALRGLTDGVRLSTSLPIRIDRLLNQLEHGDLEIGWRPEGVETIMGAANAMVNRLALSILVAAFVVGVAVLLLAYQPLGWNPQVVGLLLQVGLAIVFLLGVGIAISLLRGGGR